MQFGASSNDNEKIAVRRAARRQLRSLDPSERQNASARINEALGLRYPPAPGLVIAGFFPLPLEPDLTAYFHRLWTSGAKLAIPRLAQPGEMTFHLVPPGTLPPIDGHRATPLSPTVDPDALPPAPLRAGPHGLWEPDPTRCPAADPRTIAWALIPGLAFAPGGARLGRGAGYYDRWLATLPETIPLVGVAFSCQIQNSLPTGPHDRPVHTIVTETGWIAGAAFAPAADPIPAEIVRPLF